MIMMCSGKNGWKVGEKIWGALGNLGEALRGDADVH